MSRTIVNLADRNGIQRNRSCKSVKHWMQHRKISTSGFSSNFFRLLLPPSLLLSLFLSSTTFGEIFYEIRDGDRLPRIEFYYSGLCARRVRLLFIIRDGNIATATYSYCQRTKAKRRGMKLKIKTELDVCHLFPVVSSGSHSRKFGLSSSSRVAPSYIFTK